MSRSNPSLTGLWTGLALCIPLALSCNAAIHGMPYLDDPVGLADLADPAPPPIDFGAPHCVNLKCQIPNCTAMGGEPRRSPGW